jgi:hypothetical protein
LQAAVEVVLDLALPLILLLVPQILVAAAAVEIIKKALLMMVRQEVVGLYSFSFQTKEVINGSLC